MHPQRGNTTTRQSHPQQTGRREENGEAHQDAALADFEAVLLHLGPDRRQLLLLQHLRRRRGPLGVQPPEVREPPRLLLAGGRLGLPVQQPAQARLHRFCFVGSHVRFVVVGPGLFCFVK